MMKNDSQVILVTGGGRSGKSDYAQTRAEGLSGRRVYLATSEITDEEMAERVRKHRKTRVECGWETLEEPVALAEALRSAASADVVLVDCLTFWINNLMFHRPENAGELGEEEISEIVADVLVAARQCRGTVLFVTNEVGSGIVPENALTRRYRDLVGRCNQVVGAAADEVVLVVCGVPMKIKGKA